MSRLALIQALLLLAAIAGYADDQTYFWNLLKGFPKPFVPADNPMTGAKVDLGRYLFYDTRLSVNGKSSCASCHRQELAFTDGRPVGIGATGQQHSRNDMGLVSQSFQIVSAEYGGN